jgi:hypothetical protein
MTHAMRMEFANTIRGRYAAATNKDKHSILEEFPSSFSSSSRPATQDNTARDSFSHC